jgi:hypothetical protein
MRSRSSTGLETGGARRGNIAKRLGALAILIAVAAIGPARAEARHGAYGHGWHGRSWHGGYHGRWHGAWGYPYPYGAPAFYFPPPVVYAPPPPVYAPPPPVVYLPPPPSVNFVFSWPHD